MVELLSKLADIDVLRKLFVPWSECDEVEALDGRDNTSFDANWQRVSRQVKDIAAPPEVEVNIDRVREAVFKTVFDLTGCDDLAAYASDDFDIMIVAAVHGLSEPFLVAMWNEYFDGRFPTGDLRAVGTRTLREQIERDVARL